MKNNFRIKSMMLTVLAMLAVGVMSLGLTACSSDDDDKGSTPKSIYGQWQMSDESWAEYVKKVPFGDTFSGLAFELSQTTPQVLQYLKLKEDGKWYNIQMPPNAAIVPASDTEGKIYFEPGIEKSAVSYKLEGKKLKLSQDGITLVFNPTKGIVSAGTIDPESYFED